MRSIITFSIICLLSFTIQAQDNRAEFVEKDGLVYATYYYEDGSIEQEGTFNAEGQLHGLWTRYDVEGNKSSVGQYIDGKKNGKWFFWTGESLKEVDYLNNKIVSVNEWNDRSKLDLQTKKIN